MVRLCVCLEYTKNVRYCVWLKNNTSCTLFTNAKVLFKKTLKLAKITIIEVNSVEWLQSAAPDGIRESRGKGHWNKVKKKQDSLLFNSGRTQHSSY